MKKLVLATIVGLALTATASSTFAADENPVQVVQFKGVISKNVAGDKTAITGQNGGAILDGALAISEDASFTTTTKVTLEHHDRVEPDPLSGGESTIGDLVASTDWSVTQLQYFINGTQIRSSDLTLSDDGTELASVNGGSFTATDKIGDTTSTVVLDVTGTAATDTSELDVIQPGVNTGTVFATITAKPTI